MIDPKFRHHHAQGQTDDNTANPFDDTTGGTSASDTAAVQAAPSMTAGGASVESGGDTGGLVIDVSYDSSVTDLETSDPTLYNDYTGAVQTAVNYYESVITNPITVTIDFGWGEINGDTIAPGDIGESRYDLNFFSYSQVHSALAASDTTAPVQTAAVASLPATDPTGGANFAVSDAEQEAIGLAGANSGAMAWVGLDSSTAWSWSQANIANGTYDAVGVLEHEISEDLGRDATSGSGGIYTPLDLFRYTAANGLGTDAPGSPAGARDEPFQAGYSAGAYSYFSYNGSTVTLEYDTPNTVADGEDVADWAPSAGDDSYDGASSPGVVNSVSTTDLQELNVLGYDIVCFLSGTRIATPSGEVAVEDLATGDAVLTHRGETKTIAWIGKGKILATRGQPNAAKAVIVRKGALADNLPHRDLYITKGHSLYIDGVLVPVEFLVNHRSILWDQRTGEIELYHIELAVHDVLVANGVPAESYRDDGNRWVFRNGNTGWNQPPKPPCAPVLTGGLVVDTLWRHFLQRSGSGEAPPVTGDPDLHLLVDGVRFDPYRPREGVFVFQLPPTPANVRVISRAAAQDVLGLARDPRLLGVAIRRILLWRGPLLKMIKADEPTLSQGFHDFEIDNGFRWTNGDAVLPAVLFADMGRGFELELHVASATHYPLIEDEAA